MQSSRISFHLSTTLFLLLVLFFLLFLAARAAAGQDDMAAQQAMQAAQQANQDAMQAAQQASQQAMQDAQQANQQAMEASQQAMLDNSWPCCGAALAAAPRFSVRSGAYSKPIQVVMTDRTRGAILYYTTNGWTPTRHSQRYLGPVTISSTTDLQAVAVVPGATRSLITEATYNFPGPPPSPPASEALPVQPGAGGKLVVQQNTPVRLLFSAPVSSTTAHVGDKISLTLDEDLEIGASVLAPKGTPALGRVIQVEHTGINGLPGVIVFQVESLSLQGTRIPLRGSAALEGKSQVKKARSMSIIPLAAAFIRGQQATIPAGVEFTATLASGTVLPAPAA